MTGKEIFPQKDLDGANKDNAILEEIRKVIADRRSGKISQVSCVKQYCELQQKITVWTPDIERECNAINNELSELYKQEQANKKNCTTNSNAKEYRMRCNVCGHIFCYTDDDLKKNNTNASMGALSAIGGLASVLGGGSIFHSHHLKGQADRYADKMIDYNRCPSCHSNNISKLEDGEVTQANNTPAPASSPADELRKFKELLDMGVISQEEFDAKKKQLLGL